MTRKSLTSLALVSVLAMSAWGCSGKNSSMSMTMEKPTQPVQMKSLERFVGKWSGVAEFAPATAEKMRKAMPVSDNGKAMQTSFAGGDEWTWMMDGMTLRHEGWYDMGDGKKKNYAEVWTWDARKEKYRIFGLDNWGGHGDGWATASANGDSLHVTMTVTDIHGQTAKESGMIKFTNPNTIDWTWTVHGAGGKLEFVGSSKRSG